MPIFIADKHRHIDHAIPQKFHFGRRAGSKGSAQKSKSSRSDSNEARSHRALLKEEEQTLRKERMSKRSKDCEHRQAVLDGTLQRKASLQSSREGEGGKEAVAETTTIAVPLSSLSVCASSSSRAKKTNNKKQENRMLADIEYHQSSSTSSASDNSDKEEITRLKRKIANQNQIIKKHKLESANNKKAAMSTKKECDKTSNKYQQEKNTRNLLRA